MRIATCFGERFWTYAVRHATASNEETNRLLQNVAFDKSAQVRIAEATSPVWTLIDPGLQRV